MLLAGRTPREGFEGAVDEPDMPNSEGDGEAEESPDEMMDGDEAADYEEYSEDEEDEGQLGIPLGRDSIVPIVEGGS